MLTEFEKKSGITEEEKEREQAALAEIIRTCDIMLTHYPSKDH